MEILVTVAVQDYHVKSYTRPQERRRDRSTAPLSTDLGKSGWGRRVFETNDMTRIVVAGIDTVCEDDGKNLGGTD